MSRTLIRRTRLAAALVGVFGSLGTLSLALMPADPAPAAPLTVAVQEAAVYGPTAQERTYVRAVLGRGVDYSRAMSDAVLEAGYLACDGFAHDVPMVVITGEISSRHGFTGTEARHAATFAGRLLCASY